MYSFINKYKKTCVFLCFLLYFCCSITYANYDTVIDEITNSYKESAYNLELNAPFSKDASGIREVINPETGSLMTSIELFDLQGRGGVKSTSISLTYSTISASLKEESVQYTNKKYTNAISDKSEFLQSIESFGIGWRLQLPYVEKPDGKNSTVTYVHLADGSVYKDGENGLVGYKLADVSFIRKSETRNGVETAYILNYVTGDTYYFDTRGYPVEKTDRLGNRVFYSWSKDTIPTLKNIADDSGDIVNFEYNEKTIEISHKEKRYILYREKAGDGWIINKVTDPIGRTTAFNYNSRVFYFNFYGEARNGISNTYYLLNSVVYPTGLVSKYTYITGTKWLYEKESGRIEYAKISERFDSDNEQRADYITYSYNKEPDGCPQYKSKNLPIGYTYTTTLTDNDNAQTTYVYDKNHDQIKLSLTVDGKLSSEEKRRFDSVKRMPDMFIKTLYNENGESRNVYTESRFDIRGNLVYEDTYENPENAGKNVKEYAYSDTANLCIYESTFQDADTKVEIKRTVGYGGGTIATESVYRNGRLIKKDSFTYDEYNNLKKSHIQYNETDKLITQYRYTADTSFQYPSQMTVMGIKNGDGEEDSYTYSYTYDSYGNVIEITNPDKSRITYTYDKLSRKTGETIEDGKTRTTVYDDLKNILLTTDANGYSLLYFYDKYGKIISVYDNTQSCYLIKRAYDLKGRLIEELDSNNTKYVYSYDGLDRVTSIIVYDASGVILSEQYLQYNTAVNKNGKGYTRLFVEQGAEEVRRNKVYLFDYLDRQVQLTEQSGKEERSQYFEYDLAGNKILFTEKDGAVTKYHYDIFGNVTYALLPDGTENYFEYDYNGNCLSEINGAGEEILYSYDGLNRLIRQETTNGEKRSIFRNYYNFRNNLESTIDAENNKTEYAYNLRGFLTDVRQYSNGILGQETQYSYDGEGNIESLLIGAIGDSNKHIYQYELDVLGRCVKETDPMGNTIQYAYETDGKVSQTIDKNGIVTNYTYDGLGRLIKEENSKSGSLVYTYNEFDEITSITDGKLNVKSVYNNFGDAVKITRNRNEESFAYDYAGRITNHTITDQDIGTLTTRYSYDISGRTTAIETDGGSEYITYDKAGRIAEKSYPQTGIVKKYTYYKDSTLKSLMTYIDGELKATENIEYDRNGNKTVWEQDGKITNYTYDGMNRLQGVKESNGVLTEYEFDSFGNISREYTLTPSGIKTTHYEYDTNNCLLISFDDNSSTRYTYDKSGNLINKTYELAGSETNSWYSYDGYNRLSEYISGNTTAEYSYNPEGLRESKTVNGKYTRFIYDGANVVGELTNDNYYIYYRGTELIGSRSYDNNSYYYRLDSHGSVTDLITHTGEEIKSYTYTPYGREKTFEINPNDNETIIYQWKNETDNTHNPFRYCGEYYDEESGLIYLRNRYYDPRIGRFITEDPARDGLNWYVYCNNNPVNYIDPNGLSGIKTDGTYYITHPLDKELLKLKQEYISATPKRQAQIAVEAQNIRNSGTEGVDWSVRADRTLNYYMIDTDVTKKLNDVIKSSESENWWKRFGEVTPVTNAARYVDFALMVRPGGKYDLKSKSEWQGKEHFIYNGEIIWYDEPGNILYGHLGKVMGFEDVILKSAGGAVQIATGTSSWSYVSSYFDDPRDQKAIQKGIDIFKNTHSWIWW